MTNKPIDFASSSMLEAAYNWIFNDNPNIARLKRQATVKVCIRNLAWYFEDLFKCLNQSYQDITYSKDDDKELFSISIDKQPELSIRISIGSDIVISRYLILISSKRILTTIMSGSSL